MFFNKKTGLLLIAVSYIGGLAFAEEGPIVAKVGSRSIRTNDLKIETLPDQLRGAFKTEKEVFVFLRELAVTQSVLLEAAHKSGVQKDPNVQKTLQTVLAKMKEEAANQIILQTFIERNIPAETLLQETKKAYSDYLKTIPKNAQEVKIAHILLKDESSAKDVIADLKSGVDFMKLAREKSLDTETGTQGGTFPNYIQEGELLSDLSKAAFSLTPGRYTEHPVRSPLGWHILKVTDRRPFKPKKFDEVKDKLYSHIMNERLKSLTERLKLKASIELFDQNGQPDMSPSPLPQKEIDSPL